MKPCVPVSGEPSGSTSRVPYTFEQASILAFRQTSGTSRYRQACFCTGKNQKCYNVSKLREVPTMLYPRASARFATLLLSLSLAAWPVLASDNPGAHQHGHADLQMAIDNERVDLLLLSPAYNLIGFEHKPRTDEQQQRVNDTEQWASETAMINTVAGKDRKSTRLNSSHVRNSYA